MPTTMASARYGSARRTRPARPGASGARHGWLLRHPVLPPRPGPARRGGVAVGCGHRLRGGRRPGRSAARVGAGAPALLRPLGRPLAPPHWRRWTVYRGRRWAAVLIDCDLVRDNRRTGQLMVPRVLRVRSPHRSIDTLYVRMARGQDLTTWTEKADALAAALFAHRVAIAKVRPAVLAVVVEREMPFGHVVPAPDIPGDPREVDLTALDVGDDEHGNPFRLGLRAKHVFIAGASGAGKGSLLWSPLRAIGPMIPAGLVAGLDDRPQGRGRDRPRPGPVRPLRHHHGRGPRPAHRGPGRR